MNCKYCDSPCYEAEVGWCCDHCGAIYALGVDGTYEWIESVD